jgi:hypothetical protein
MMRVAIRRSSAVGLVVALTGTGAVSAHDAPAVTVGPRVRVTAPAVSGKRLVGTLLAMDEATLTIGLQDGKGVREVPRRAVTRIEVSRRPSRKGKGAGIGALVGLGVGVAIGLASGDDCSRSKGGWEGFLDGQIICFDRTSMAAGMSLLTIPAGALVGMGVAGGERWARTTPDRLSLSVKPTRTGGLAAGLSLRF